MRAEDPSERAQLQISAWVECHKRHWHILPYFGTFLRCVLTEFLGSLRDPFPRNSVFWRLLVRIATLLFLLASVPALAAPALFPQPLHLVRRIDDPFAKAPITVDEYCYGNRIVTVSGDRVKVVDYDEQTITEIDHAKATYSITRFDEIAKARPQNKGTAPKAASKVTPLGMKGSAAGRSVDSFQIENPQMRVVIGVDRSVTLSREAVEALIGASYPNTRREEHDQMLGVAAGRAGGGGRIAANSADGKSADVPYGLPSDQTITYQTEGGAVTSRSSVLRVDGDLPPRDSMLIEPGATRVESHLTRLQREMHDADTIPTASPKP
jgi:hypothetical protein